MQGVQYTREGNVAFIGLDEGKGNLISSATRRALYEAFKEYKGDHEAWVAVLSSTGPDFCLGSVEERAETAASKRQRGTDWAGGFHEIWKPTIAAVQGRCVAEGAALALSCDFRIADATTTIDVAFTGEASVPNVAAAWLLNLVGISKTFEILWLGEALGAESAMRLGLVNRIVRRGAVPAPPPEEGRLPMNPLEATVTTKDGLARSGAIAFAHELLLNAPMTRMFQKEIAYRSIGVPFQFAQTLEIGRNPLGSADRIEGNRAFVENRRPVWRNQ